MVFRLDEAMEWLIAVDAFPKSTDQESQNAVFEKFANL